MSVAKSHIILEEQGLRDGLQTLAVSITLAKKLKYIEQLIEAGIQRIQVGSFVHPKMVPQMADTEMVIAQLPKTAAVVFSALVLNKKGVERAAASGIQHLAVSLSASDTHSRKNANMGLTEAKTAFCEMVSLAHQSGIVVRGGIQCAFGCRYEGRIQKSQVLDLVKHHLDCGVDELALADSTGMGHPAQIQDVMASVKAIAGDTPIAMHLHNTENKGYANVLAAIEVGIRQFDTAFGGLGGCPFIQGATGNIATEDTAHMLHQMGYTTGINIGGVAAVSRDMEATLGAPLPGLLYGLINRADIAIIE